MILALFDFDGTITTDDSLIKFIRFVRGDAKTLLGMVFLSPILTAYKLKLIPNYKAKQLMLSYFFKGMVEQQFRKVAEEYSLKHIDSIVRQKAMDRINWHKEQGHTVVIVSASVECWLKGWCKKNNVELLGTKLEFSNNKFTGKFSTKNCYGVEKVNRINNTYNLSNYKTIFAYGDSSGDKEMLAIADSKYYKYFE